MMPGRHFAFGAALRVMSLDQLVYPQGMVHRLPAMTYIHVLDTNTQVRNVEGRVRPLFRLS